MFTDRYRTPVFRFGKTSSLSDWGFDLREARSVLSQIVGYVVTLRGSRGRPRVRVNAGSITWRTVLASWVGMISADLAAVKSEDCWIISSELHPLRVAF